MAQGLRLACEQLARRPPETAKRLILLTDGGAFDEDQCRLLAEKLAASSTPIIAIGIGDEYNEDLLLELAEITQGRPYHLEEMELLREVLDVEIGSSVREVVTDLQARVAVAEGVRLESITRVYPSLAPVNLAETPHRLGNVAAGDYTVFILEFTVEGREHPPGQVRLAQLGLSGYVPGLKRRDELPPLDLRLNFTLDEAAIAAVDPEVLGYVQQRNVDQMVQEAAQWASKDAGRARRTLEAALNITRRLGNVAVTRALQRAIDELDQKGALSSCMTKAIRIGGRTHIMKVNETKASPEVLPEEEIRRLTGV
jgi:Ca-activated chloride channel family protein